MLVSVYRAAAPHAPLSFEWQVYGVEDMDTATLSALRTSHCAVCGAARDHTGMKCVSKLFERDYRQPDGSLLVQKCGAYAYACAADACQYAAAKLVGKRVREACQNSKIVYTTCTGCGAIQEEKMSTCSGCLRAYYCSPACQKAHWIRHKECCMQFQC